MVGAEIPNPIPGVEEAPTLPLAAALAAARAATGFCAEDEAAMIQQSNIIVDKLAAAVGPAGLDGLTRDEAAAINIYTQEEPHSIYSVLNGMLRNGDPGPLKQWFPYLKLLLTALHKLPSCPGTYNRSVSADIASQYTKGKKMVWWEFSSSTATIEALGAFMQVGEPRVLFQLEVKRAVDINRFSSFSGDEVVDGVGEDERLLLSGIPLEVKSTMQMGGGLTMVQMTEELDRPPLLPGFTLKPPPPWEVDPKEIKIDMEEDEDDDDGAMVKIELGRGSFGTVYAGRFRGHVVAIKQLPAGSEEMIKAFRSEASIAFRLQHKNVAHCYGGVIKQKFVRLISERLEASLHNELHIVKVEMSAEVVRDTISQVAQGLAYLHQNKVVHRDLKPDNVMRNAKRVWKLIDFGLASSRSSSMATKSSVSGANRGTAGYMAPELYTAAGGNHTVDTFAFAMLAYETAVRSPPFSGAEALAVPDMIKSGKRPDLVDSHANLTADISDLIRACWDHKPERRPDMLAVAAHLANADTKAYRKRLSMYLKDGMLDADGMDELKEEFGEVSITKRDSTVAEILAAQTAGGAAHAPAAASVPKSVGQPLVEGAELRAAAEKKSVVAAAEAEKEQLRVEAEKAAAEALAERERVRIAEAKAKASMAGEKSVDSTAGPTTLLPKKSSKITMLKCKNCSATFDEGTNAVCPKGITVEERYYPYSGRGYSCRRRGGEGEICGGRDQCYCGLIFETRKVTKPGGKHIPTPESLQAAKEQAKRDAAAAAAASAFINFAFGSIPAGGEYKLSGGGSVVTKIKDQTYTGVVADGGGCAPMVDGRHFWQHEIVKNDAGDEDGSLIGSWCFGVCRPGINLNDQASKDFCDRNDTWMMGQDNDPDWDLECKSCKGTGLTIPFRKLNAGDRVGLLLDLYNGGTLTMYLNGKPCGTIAEGLEGPLYPCIVSRNTGKAVQIHSGLEVPN